MDSRLKNFIIEKAGVDNDEVSLEAALEKDLGVYGDDAIELLVSFGKEFNVDVSKFLAAEYFSPDGDFILPAIIRFFTGNKRKKKKELTVAHLQKALLAGRLDEEVINS